MHANANLLFQQSCMFYEGETTLGILANRVVDSFLFRTWLIRLRNLEKRVACCQ